MINNDIYYLNQKILYKKYKKNRYDLYNITNINKNILELKNNYDEKIIINLDKKNYIKKYITYNKTEIIYCDLYCNKTLIFSFYCNFCNKIHKHNRLGNNDCKCISNYSPYYKHGYILKLKQFNLDIVNFNYYENFDIINNYFKNKLILKIKHMEFNNFNEYLLHNYKLLLIQDKLSERTIIWYVRYIKQFYEGSICEKYGVNNFPYISLDKIEIIKNKFQNETKIKRLLTTLRKFITLFTNNDLLFILDKYNENIKDLKLFYKNIQKEKDIKTKEKDIKTKEKDIKTKEKDIKIKEKFKELIENFSIKNIKIEEEKNNNTKLSLSSVESSNIEKYNKIDNKIDSKNIILDIEDSIKLYIDNKIKKEIKNKIINLNKDSFYIKLKEKIPSSMLGYIDLWITIDNYGNNLWGVSDTNEISPDFIKYKQELTLLEN